MTGDGMTEDWEKDNSCSIEDFRAGFCSVRPPGKTDLQYITRKG